MNNEATVAATGMTNMSTCDVLWMIRGRSAGTFQFSVWPPSQLTGLACELVLDILVVFAGGADPAAAHFSLPDNLSEIKRRHFPLRESDLCSAYH